MLGVKLLVQNIYRKFNNDDYYNFHDIKEKLKKKMTRRKNVSLIILLCKEFVCYASWLVTHLFSGQLKYINSITC